MAIDASIYGQIQAPKENNLLAQYGQIQAIQGAQNQNRLAELMYGDKQREVESARAMDSAYRSATGPDGVIDRQKLYSGIAQTSGSKLPGVQRGFAETDKLEVESQKNKIALQGEQLALAGRLLGGVTDQSTYDAARQSATANGLDVANMPAQYNPAFVASKLKEAMTVKEQLDNYWKQMAYDKPDANAALSAATSTANNAATNERSRLNNAATVGASYAGQAQSAAQHANTLGKPFEVTGPEGTPILVRQDRQGNISRVDGFGPKSGNVKLTEDQGKATGWLVQAENAFSNMSGAMSRTPSSAQPGFNDALAAIPSFGMTTGIANALRSPDRQQFIQGASSLSESLLRAATGAGVNKDEAVQKVQELTPVFGEAESTTKQKMAAIPIYIEALKVRAGPGAKQVPGIFDRASPGAGIDALLNKYK